VIRILVPPHQQTCLITATSTQAASNREAHDGLRGIVTAGVADRCDMHALVLGQSLQTLTFCSQRVRQTCMQSWHSQSQLQCRLRPSRVLWGPFAARRAACLANFQTDQLPRQISGRPLQTQRCCMATHNVHKSNRAVYKLGLTGSIGSVPSNCTNSNSDRQEKYCLGPQEWARARWLKCLSDRAFRCGMLIRQA